MRMSVRDHTVSKPSLLRNGRSHRPSSARHCTRSSIRTITKSISRPTINTDSKLTTLVNVFAVEPVNQQKLIELLKEGTESFFSKMPGFVSSSVLRGKGGQQVINVSQWRSVEDIAAFRQDSRFGPYIQRIIALAKAETIECDVTYVNRA